MRTNPSEEDTESAVKDHADEIDHLCVVLETGTREQIKALRCPVCGNRIWWSSYVPDDPDDRYSDFRYGCCNPTGCFEVHCLMFAGEAGKMNCVQFFGDEHGERPRSRWPNSQPGENENSDQQE